MKLHPVAQLLPALAPGELDALRTSIAEHGVLDAVVVDERERIVDGRHRAQLATALGQDYPTRPLPEGVTAWAYGLTANLDRRHLSAEQRAAVVLLAEQKGQAPEVEQIREQARERQGERTDLQPSPNVRERSAAEAIGDLVGVSRATVENVERAARTSPDALAEIAAGATTSRRVIEAAKPERAQANGPGPDPFLEMPCPTCGRWTPQWVIIKAKPPEGATWRWLTLRGSMGMRSPRKRKGADATR